MHTLLVVANPESGSLTHHVARKVADALRPETVEIADLAKEGFDPRYTLADRQAYRDTADLSPDVPREQRRLDRVTDLVLVFPVCWWSMPALLKGWVDRVFVGGWAFDHAATRGLQPRLQGLTTHLLPIAGDNAGVYERHEYERALRTQIEHGIVDNCGSRRGATAFLYESERVDSSATASSVDRAVAIVSGAISAHPDN